MKLPSVLSRVVSGEYTITSPILSLLGANLVTIILAVIGNWDAATVLFIYWAQSVIIGIFAVISLLDADTEALATELERSLRERGGSGRVSTRFTRFYQYLLAGFFALHYGLFHWGYYSFIVDSGLFGGVEFASPDVWIACGLFFANHLYSFLYHRPDPCRVVDYVNEEFIRPYYRIVPMHLTILFGAMVMLVLTVAGVSSTTLPVLVLFLLLKTYADMGMHVRKHGGGGHEDGSTHGDAGVNPLRIRRMAYSSCRFNDGRLRGGLITNYPEKKIRAGRKAHPV
jgi:hypothetical protein